MGDAWAICSGLGFVLLAIRAHVGLPLLVFAMSAGPLLATSLNAAELFWKRFPWLRPRVSSVTRATARALLGTGLYFFAIQLAVAAAYQSDVIIVAQILGAEAVPQYTVPMKLFMLAPMVLGFALVPLWPAYAEAFSRGDARWAMETLRRSIITALLIGVPAALLLVLLGPAVLRVWVGPGIQPTTSLLVAAGLWSVLACFGGALAMFLNGAGVLRLQAVLAIVMTIGNVALSVALTSRIGVSGVVWGSVIAQSVFITLPTIVFLIGFRSRYTLD